MTVLDVDKIKSQFPRPGRGGVKLLHDCVQLGLGQQRKIIRQSKPSIQNRMVKGNAWLGAVMFVRPTVAPRVRQLQSYQQTVLGSSCKPMFLDQVGAQLRQSLLRMVCNEQLIGICTSFMCDGDRFPTPNQFGSAGAKAAPAPNGAFTRRAI